MLMITTIMVMVVKVLWQQRRDTKNTIKDMILETTFMMELRVTR